MGQDQQQQPLAPSARFFYWMQVGMLVVIVGIQPIILDDWTRWDLLYFASVIVLLICVFPKLVWLEQPVTRWIMRRYGRDA